MRRLCPECGTRAPVHPVAPDGATAPASRVVWVWSEHGCPADWTEVDPPRVIEPPDLPPPTRISPPTGILRGGSSAAIVLGLLDAHGPATSTDLSDRQDRVSRVRVRKILHGLRLLGYASGSGGWGQTWTITDEGLAMLREIRQAGEEGGDDDE